LGARQLFLVQSELTQLCGPIQIFDHSASLTVHASKFALRHGIALVRSELEQLCGPLLILGHFVSLTVHAA
jgi:hypothetical protein